MTQERRIATVSQMNTYIKSLLDSVPILKNIWIRGEISNFKKHFSGHMYLTLKDEGGVIRACMFKGANQHLAFMPENGMKVLARGRVGVYERDGQYQLYIEEMEPDGIGDLHVAFEKLKAKLREEGLFDESRKKPIPKFPRAVGVVTSDTGAAVRDIINILTRRYRYADIVLYPVRVQGDGAAKEICAAISYFNQAKNVDVLIVGRGGGSIEDLWAFNEEETARAVAASAIPVISAVGHETDFTICDFAADLRAPTPSAAAELATPSSEQLLSQLAQVKKRLAFLLVSTQKRRRERLLALQNAYGFTGFLSRIQNARLDVDNLHALLYKNARNLVEGKRHALAKQAASLNALSPLAVLERGYALAYKDGARLASVSDAAAGDELMVRLADGEIDCQVTKVQKKGI